jgi:hypothetical protein
MDLNLFPCSYLLILIIYVLLSLLQLQRNALVAQEQAKTADEKLSALATIEKSKQVLSYPHQLAMFFFFSNIVHKLDV